MRRDHSLTWLLIGVAATTALARDIGSAAQTVDYVIVGAGPAGMVLAERLSRDGTNKIVLLEAGPKEFNATLLNSKLTLKSINRLQSLPFSLFHSELKDNTQSSSCPLPFYHRAFMELHRTAG
jgi:choline dehydrogenase-like flavoprotein